jgi:hypothetical protein
MSIRSVYFSPATHLLIPLLTGGEKPLEGEPALGPGAAPVARPGPGMGSGREKECGGSGEGAVRG